MSDTVTIFEMAPRDGLQNEARVISTADKVKLVDLLAKTGVSKIETASFVSPKWVPQMADGAEVLAGIVREPGVAYTALVPNMTGLDRALQSRADEIAVFGAASETFSQKNINCSIDEALDRFAPVVERALEVGLPVRGYVSCVTDCPYEGEISPQAVARVAGALRDLGCYEVSLGDTIGRGTPDRVAAMLAAMRDVVPADCLAGHFHDTAGMALENIKVSLDAGLRVFDASAGGLGGCPFAPGAAGNVATEAVVEMLYAQGIDTGIDAKALSVAADFARGLRQG